MRLKMHSFIVILTLLCTVGLMAQDIAGDYKMNGLYVVYHDIIRSETNLVVTDTYGMGITIPISTMPEGYVFYHTYNGPHSEAALTATGINLKNSFGADGIGSITEGSFYPDVNAVDCISQVQVLPITDDMEYSSNLDADLTIPAIDMIGYPSPSIYAGNNSGSLSLSTGFVLDYFPATPTNVTLPSAYFIDFEPDGNIDVYVPAGTNVPGTTCGYVKKDAGMVSMSDINQSMGVYPDMYVEWHALDGPISESGLGDIVGEDEDGLTGDYDRIFGLPYVTVTYMSAACGFNYPIAGDVSAVFEDLGLGACVEEVSVGNDMYLMDAQFATWGNFLTMNGVVFSGTLEALMLQGFSYEDALNYIITNQPGLLADDSDHDFNGVDGRLVMNFAPTCLPEYESRLVMLEFRDINAGCAHDGDVDGDGALTVTDIVASVGYILGNNDLDQDQFCNADMNGDQNVTVLDIVQMVSYILTPRISDQASALNITNDNNSVSFESNGMVGGIEMVLSHSENFSLDLTSNALVSDYRTDGNSTHLMIIAPNSNELFTAQGDFVIESILAASGSDYIDVTIQTPTEFSISPAYPNPFNPVTQMTLSLDVGSDVSMVVFNIKGQIVSTLVNEYRDAGNYDITWNASTQPSGMYFVKTMLNSQSYTQKLILLK